MLLHRSRLVLTKIANDPSDSRDDIDVAQLLVNGGLGTERR